MTYAQRCGYEPFNWPAFIDDAEAGHLSHSELSEATQRAAEWPTCACGNQCARIPRGSENGMPHDFELREEGVTFYNNIKYQRWDAARETLARIEKRSTQILAELYVVRAVIDPPKRTWRQRLADFIFG